MRYLSLFSGIEAASLAWEPLGWEPMAFCEVDEFPAAVLAHRWPDVPNLGDITKVNWKEVIEKHGRPDVVVGGSPCFPAGTIVDCRDSYKPIEEVRVGDMVLTHKMRYRRVLDVGSRTADVVRLTGEYGRTLTCTPNHPILSDSAQWVPAAEMIGRKWLYVDHGSFETVVSIEPVDGGPVIVYNLEVEDDNSYTADGIAVHNCQSFSIAGGRESLGGESRLMFEYIRALSEVRPKWFIWENVPGVLNTRDDAFAQLLREVQDIGYDSLAWRVLDAQFFGVAQRRRRVFLVGHLGSGGGAAAVLFESESVRGNTQTSKQKREELTRAAGRGASADCSAGFCGYASSTARSVGYTEETAPTTGPEAVAIDFKQTPKFTYDMCHTLTHEGDGGIHSAVVEPIAFKWFQGARAGTMPSYDEGTTPTISCSDSHVSAVAFAQNTRDEVRLIGGDGSIAGCVNAERWGTHKSETLICMTSGQSHGEIDDDLCGTLSSRSYKDQPMIVREVADGAQERHGGPESP